MVDFQRNSQRSKTSLSDTQTLDTEFDAVPKELVQMERPQEVDRQSQRSQGFGSKSMPMNNTGQILSERHHSCVDVLALRAREIYEAQKRRRRRRLKNKMLMIALFISLLTGIWFIHKLAE